MFQKHNVSLNAFQLKIIALIMYTVGRCSVEITYNRYNGNTAGDFTGGWRFLFTMGYVLTYIAMPIICFLTVEGVLKTGNLRQYFTRLITAALLTEIAFDLAIFGPDGFNGTYALAENPIFASSNYFVTMTLGAAATALMDRVVKKKFRAGSVPFVLFNVLILMGMSAAAVLLRSEQNAIGVLTMSVFYLFYGNAFFTLALTAILQILALGSAMPLIMFAPVLGALIVAFYDGKEGYKTGLVRLVTYAAYPLCYTILILILKYAGVSG